MSAGPDADGLIGEAWSGEAPNGSHVNLVIARRGSPTAAAAAGALCSPSPGHVPFLSCLGPGVVVRPATIVINKATIAADLHGRVTWGAAQLGVSQGVADALADGTLDAADAAELILLVALWVDPAASDETAVRLACREAMRRSLDDALAPDRSAHVEHLIAIRETATNAYYGGE